MATRDREKEAPMRTVRAVYENGVFRPTEPFVLPEHSLVEFEPRPLEQSEADSSLDAIYESCPADLTVADTTSRHATMSINLEPGILDRWGGRGLGSRLEDSA